MNHRTQHTPHSFHTTQQRVSHRMRHRHLYKTIGLWSAFSTFILSHRVYAQASKTNIIDSGTASSESGLGTATPTEVVGAIISGFLGVLGIIALVLIIYSGFKWMTAGGNEENITKAKETLQAATIGLLIILAAYGIALFVFSSIEKATGYK